jgi:hypothetical protein
MTTRKWIQEKFIRRVFVHLFIPNAYSFSIKNSTLITLTYTEVVPYVPDSMIFFYRFFRDLFCPFFPEKKCRWSCGPMAARRDQTKISDD